MKKVNQNPHSHQKAKLRQFRLFAVCAVYLNQDQKGLMEKSPTACSLAVQRNKNKQNHMRLTEKEYYRFLRIHISLIHFSGIEEGLIPKKLSLEEFKDTDIETKFPVRESLYDNPKYFDKFIKENPYDLSNEDLQVADNFRHFKKGKFWLLKYLKKHSIFLDEDFAYGVLALSDPFEWFFGNNLPTMVETVLLPFEGKIVYDGMMKSSNIIIGGNITSSLNSEYSVLKAKYGLITQLRVYNKLHKTQRQPSAFKPYGCWGRASRSAPAYPGEANGKCWQAIQKVQFVMHTSIADR
ncbi:hypothetical protein [Phaeodactylibacter xiamenensis]|uniref:hypothetical protein n=1 Tax=Phaeodactylibacter xiamenensis TaxID=1524460 RepID=UPI003CCBD515